MTSFSVLILTFISKYLTKCVRNSNFSALSPAKDKRSEPATPQTRHTIDCEFDSLDSS